MTPMHDRAQRPVWRRESPAYLDMVPFLTGYGLNDELPEDPFRGMDVSKERIFQMLEARLQGTIILLVEDEAIVAMDINFALTDVGAQVLGPAASLSEGLSLARETLRIDGAILDIDLGGDDVMQLAELLEARSVPFLFHTGGPPFPDIATRFPDVTLLRKPVPVEDLLLRLADRME